MSSRSFKYSSSHVSRSFTISRSSTISSKLSCTPPAHSLVPGTSDTSSSSTVRNSVTKLTVYKLSSDFSIPFWASLMSCSEFRITQNSDTPTTSASLQWNFSCQNIRKRACRTQKQCSMYFRTASFLTVNLSSASFSGLCIGFTKIGQKG